MIVSLFEDKIFSYIFPVLLSLLLLFFHFAQYMKKPLAGLEHSRKSINEFSLKAKITVILAFIPISKIDEAIEHLADALPNKPAELVLGFLRIGRKLREEMVGESSFLHLIYGYCKTEIQTVMK